jgi:cbb3-type cytochrome oxidase cytochrome c subunit
MRGLLPLFLWIFGTFAFSWVGLTVIPNLQIGALNPQTDEEGGDVYPAPASGMMLRGARVYAANGCVYCHSQQVRPDYAAADIDRKWGERRSAPRDYVFHPIVFLGQMRTGPDLASVGKRPALQEQGAAATAAATTKNSAPIGSPAPAVAGSPVPTTPAGTPAASASAETKAAASVAPGASASPSASVAAATASASPPPPQAAPATTSTAATPAEIVAPTTTPDGKPLPYTAAWHHQHLYAPRSITPDSNMPAFRFLYQKRRINGEASPDSLNFAGNENDRPAEGWEIVPSYDAKCLVAYLMSLDQSHALKEAKSATAPASSPAPGKEAKK